MFRHPTGAAAVANYGAPPVAALPEKVRERMRREAKAERKAQVRAQEKAQQQKSKPGYRGRQRQGKGGVEDVAFVVGMGILALVVFVALLPVFAVAIGTWFALALKRPRWYFVLPLPVAGIGALAYFARPRVEAEAQAYVDRAFAILNGPLPPPEPLYVALAYLKAAAPSAAVAGLLLGMVFYVGTAHKLKPRARPLDLLDEDDANEYAPPVRTPMQPIGATEIRQQDHSEANRVLVQRFLGTRRMTAIASWPKMGKSFATGGMIGESKRGGEWFGQQVAPFRSLWLTEESPGGFADTANTFDLDTATCRVDFAQRFLSAGWMGVENWEDLVEYVYSNAKAEGRDCVIWDSLTTFAPWALASPQNAQACFIPLMSASEKYDMATLIIAHNNKSGKGDDPVLDMLGSIGVAALLSQVSSYKRDRKTGICTLNVQGRKLNGEDGEWEQQATLKGNRFVCIGRATVTETTRGADPSKTTVTVEAATDGAGNTPAQTDPNQAQLPPPNQPSQTQAQERAHTVPKTLLGALLAIKLAPDPRGGNRAYVASCTRKSGSQCYRDLAKLTEMGLLNRVGDSEAGTEFWQITDKGRAAVA
jgi:AAA domain-containing protein